MAELFSRFPSGVPRRGDLMGRVGKYRKAEEHTWPRLGFSSLLCSLEWDEEARSGRQHGTHLSPPTISETQNLMRVSARPVLSGAMHAVCHQTTTVVVYPDANLRWVR